MTRECSHQPAAAPVTWEALCSRDPRERTAAAEALFGLVQAELGRHLDAALGQPLTDDAGADRVRGVFVVLLTALRQTRGDRQLDPASALLTRCSEDALRAAWREAAAIRAEWDALRSPDRAVRAAAIERLYVQVEPRLLAWLGRDLGRAGLTSNEATDLLNAAFVVLLDRLEVGRVSWQGRPAEALLNGIAGNLLKDARRTAAAEASRRAQLWTDDGDAGPYDLDDPWERVADPGVGDPQVLLAGAEDEEAAVALWERLLAALATMPGRRGEVYLTVLGYLISADDWSASPTPAQRAAQDLGLRVNYVHVIMHRVRARLCELGIEPPRGSTWRAAGPARARRTDRPCPRRQVAARGGRSAGVPRRLVDTPG